MREMEDIKKDPESSALVEVKESLDNLADSVVNELQNQSNVIQKANQEVLEALEDLKKDK